MRLDSVVTWLKKYPVVAAGVFIYGYYLTTTVNFFQRSSAAPLGILDFTMQFDSLLWMWLTAFVFIKFQQSDRKALEGELARTAMSVEVEKSRAITEVLGEVTTHLQDAVNNPLAVIGVSTMEIRKAVRGNGEIEKRLDQIDSSLRRVHHAIKDVASHQTGQLLESMQQKLSAIQQRKSGVEQRTTPNDGQENHPRR